MFVRLCDRHNVVRVQSPQAAAERVDCHAICAGDDFLWAYQLTGTERSVGGDELGGVHYAQVGLNDGVQVCYALIQVCDRTDVRGPIIHVELTVRHRRIQPHQVL